MFSLTIKFFRNHLAALLPFFLYLVLNILVTYPAINSFNSELIGDGGDSIEYYSYQELALQNLQSGKHPFAYTNTYRYPFGYNFGAGSDARAFVFTGSLLSPFLGKIFTYNLLLWLVLAANGYASYKFFSVSGFTQTYSLLGSILYGYSYFVLSKGAGHINLMQIYGFPFLGYTLISLYKHPEKRRYISLLFLSLFSIIASSIQYFLVLIASGVILTPLFVLWFKKEAHRILINIKPQLFLVIINFLLFLLLLFYFFSPFFTLLFTYSLPGNLIGVAPPLQSYVSPNNQYPTLLYSAFNRLFGEVTPDGIDNSLYLGTVELCLFILFIFLHKKSRSYWFLLSSVALLFIVALYINSSFFVFRWIKQIPPFNFIAEAERNFPILYLLLITSIISLLNTKMPPKIVLPLLLVGFLVERVSFQYFTSPVDGYRPYMSVVAKQPQGGVLDIPLVWDNFKVFRGVEYNLLPFHYQKPIVEGYFNWIAETKINRAIIDHPLVRQLYCVAPPDYTTVFEVQGNIVNLLVDHSIYTIVIHKKQFLNPACYDARKRSLLLFQDLSEEEADISHDDYLRQKATSLKKNALHRIYTDDDAIVYTINP